MTAPENRPESRLDNPLEQRARYLYQQAARQLDPNTAGRLRAARRSALEATASPVARLTRWLIPTGAFAVIALAALVVWQTPSQHGKPAAIQTSTTTPSDLDSDLPPDADQTDPNLYQNLDFYGWLASTSKQPAAR